MEGLLMPNNFVFDTVAQDLKTQIFGSSDGVNTVPVHVDAAGNLEMGVSFTSLTASLTAPASGTGIAITLDSSEKSLYSFYAMNSGTSTLTVKLQVSPTTVASYFIDDSSTPVVLAPAGAAVLVPKYYLNYTRLYYTNNDTANTASLQAYCDARA
jgi:hypothetical protein